MSPRVRELEHDGYRPRVVAAPAGTLPAVGGGGAYSRRPMGLFARRDGEEPYAWQPPGDPSNWPQVLAAVIVGLVMVVYLVGEALGWWSG